MEDNPLVKCPNCGTSIDVQDILSNQLEEEIKLKYQIKLAEENKKFDTKLIELNREKEQFESLKKKENELFQHKLETKLKEARLKLESDIKTKLLEEQSEQFQSLQKELNEKSEQIKQLNLAKIEVEKLRREKAELKDSIEAESQVKLNELLQLEQEKIKKREEEKSELRIKELQKQLDDQKRLTEEMKRKQEQGSTQLQGEIQELAIEEWLINQFPLDTIVEIKKGARGGDCVHIVNTRSQQNCGKIYYESKRTKDFQSGWIEKFKSDMREKNADIGVIVTEAMPPGFERMGILEGIWVCNYEEFKGLCAVLRESIVQLSLAVSSQENKGDKMHLLYEFLTSNTFRMQVEAIVDGFSSMKIALDSEKRAMQKIWKEREKQIDKVVSSTVEMYASIRGIAGNAVQTVKSLELYPNEEVKNDDK